MDKEKKINEVKTINQFEEWIERYEYWGKKEYANEELKQMLGFEMEEDLKLLNDVLSILNNHLTDTEKRYPVN